MDRVTPLLQASLEGCGFVVLAVNDRDREPRPMLLRNLFIHLDVEAGETTHVRGSGMVTPER